MVFSVFGQSQELGTNENSLLDFGRDLNRKIANNEIDLLSNFSVEFVGELDNKGNFISKKSKFTSQEGDKKIIKVVKRAIKNLTETGYFKYLGGTGFKEVKINLRQNDTELTSLITCVV